MKTRQQKEQIVQDYVEKLKKAKSVILASFLGLKTKDLFKLKTQLTQKADFKIVKNKLLGLALKMEKIEIPEEILDKPLALAFSCEDEMTAAKIIYDFAKENEGLEIFGGIQDKEFVEAEKIKILAMLPSHEELHARLVFSLSAPKSKLLNILTQNQNKLIYLLKQMTANG